jgi:hypothetical protein
MAFSVSAALEIWESENGRPDLPAENHSMLFRFRSGSGEEVTFGANALDREGIRFAPGSSHTNVTLTFWAEQEAVQVIHAGDSFVVWYSRDIGVGRVIGLG